MFKRFIGALCLLLVCSHAFAAVSVRMDGGALLLKANGRAIVEEGEYGDIVPLGGDLFAAGGPDKYILINEKGRKAGKQEYSYIEYGEHAIVAEVDGKFGLIDRKGKQLSEFKYSAITADASGACWVLYGDRDSALGMHLYMLDENMQETDTGLRLLSIGNKPYDGLLSVRNTAGFYGYINLEGKMAIEAQYSHASDFINGCAAVALDEKFAAIDTEGTYIVPAEYDFLQVSEYGYIIAAQTSKRVAIFDMKGKLIDEYFGKNISAALVGSCYTVCDEVSLRVYSENHEMLFEMPPSASVSAGIGGQLIVSTGVFGEKGTSIWGTDISYQNIIPLGTIDGEGIYATMSVDTVKYENHMLDEIQYSLDMSSVRYGAINSKGEVLLWPRYLHIEMLGEDRLLVQTEDQWQMIDISGKVYWSKDIQTQPSGE